jgi:hypothetical protein
LKSSSEDYLKKFEFASSDEIYAFRSGVDEKIKANQWYAIDPDTRSHYNLMNWTCLYIKGNVMLEAYYRDILPKFTEIIALQKKISVENNDGDKIDGIAEFVAKLASTGEICLIDNKTSSSVYEADSVRRSQQLALYKEMLNILADNNSPEWNLKIGKAGYAVVSKKLVRTVTKTCVKCGHVTTSMHKTCNNTVGNGRCGGSWNEVSTWIAPTQLLVDEISPDFGISVLENASNIMKAIKNDIFPKNFERCYDDFGSVCPYLALCHKKHADEAGNLFKLEEYGDKNGEEAKKSV